VWDDIAENKKQSPAVPLPASMDLLFFARTHQDFERWTFEVAEEDSFSDAEAGSEEEP
jgi:hypothetical protein